MVRMDVHFGGDTGPTLLDAVTDQGQTQVHIRQGAIQLLLHFGLLDLAQVAGERVRFVKAGGFLARGGHFLLDQVKLRLSRPVVHSCDLHSSLVVNLHFCLCRCRLPQFHLGYESNRVSRIITSR